MAFVRHVVAMLAAFAILVGVADAHSKGRRQRLAVTVTKVGKKAPVGQALKLRSRVAWSGRPAKFHYEWSTVSGPPLPDGADPNDKDLELRAGSLEPGQHYHFRLTVIASVQPSEDEDEDEGPREIRASGDVKFQANESPSGGTCNIKADPLRGQAVRLSLSAPGWSDPDGVQYRFEVRRGDRIVAVQNWRHFSTYDVTLLLKPGQQVFARCHVRDRFGDGGSMDSRLVGPK